MRPVMLASFVLVLACTSVSVVAQPLCQNEAPLFTENFGTGTTPNSSADIISTALTYQENGDLVTDGVYRIANNTLQNPAWHSSTDHTGSVNGKMLIVNGNGNRFYSHVATIPSGFQPGYYAISLYFMNLNLLANCPSNNTPLLSFMLEYQAQNGTWVALGGSTVTATLVSSPTWVRLAGLVTLPVTGFPVTNLRLSINDGITNVCGNDFAIDDINISACASGGPLPVDFSNVSAQQRGAGVAINWSTASETNNKYFDIEKSIDAGKSWGLVTSLTTSGINSSVKKEYGVIDQKPVGGLNYYRIKQVDFDGNFKYSKTVFAKISIDKTVASVNKNPFVNNISVNFLSKNMQRVTLSLFDVTGKLIASNRTSISNGTSTVTLGNVGNVQKGTYILKIVDENGASLYNGKLIKQ